MKFCKTAVDWKYSCLIKAPTYIPSSEISIQLIIKGYYLHPKGGCSAHILKAGFSLLESYSNANAISRTLSPIQYMPYSYLLIEVGILYYLDYIIWIIYFTAIRFLFFLADSSFNSAQLPYL